MKIAYGVNGEGRGHVTRLLSIVPKLDAEFMIFAGGDAHQHLTKLKASLKQHQLIEIPTLRFSYKNGNINQFKSIQRNLPLAFDFKFGGRTTKKVEKTLEGFRPDLIISDSEQFINHSKRSAPLLSFDRFGKIAFCKTSIKMESYHKAQRSIHSRTYKILLGNPEHIITTSFYDAKPKKQYKNRVLSYGPILRKEILDTHGEDMDHIVVYATNPYIFNDHFFNELNKLGRQVFVYGSGRTGQHGNVTFCEIDPIPFIEHLRTSAFVISTPGNVLLSEIRHFKKKVLLFWTDPIEQRENALIAEYLGFAKRISSKTITAEEIEILVESLVPAEPIKDSIEEVVRQIESIC